MRNLPQGQEQIEDQELAQAQAQEIFAQVRLLLNEYCMATEVINFAKHIVQNLPASDATVLAAATISTTKFKNGHLIDTAKLLTAGGLAIHGLDRSMAQAAIAGRKMVKRYVDGKKLEALKETAHGVFLGVVSAVDGAIILGALQNESVNVAVNSVADAVGIPDVNVIAKAAIIGGMAAQLCFIAGATWQGYQEGAFSSARDHAYMMGRAICTQARELIASRSQQVVPQQEEMDDELDLEVDLPRLPIRTPQPRSVVDDVSRRPQPLQPPRDSNSSSQGV